MFLIFIIFTVEIKLSASTLTGPKKLRTVVFCNCEQIDVYVILFPDPFFPLH